MDELDEKCETIERQINELQAQLSLLVLKQMKLGKKKCDKCGKWRLDVQRVEVWNGNDVVNYCAICRAKQEQEELLKQEQHQKEMAGEIPMFMHGMWRIDMPGCVYVIHDMKWSRYKIGATYTNLQARVDDYCQGYEETDAKFVMAILTQQPFRLERFLHMYFRAKRLYNNEVFTLDDEDLTLLKGLESGMFPAYQPLKIVYSISEADAWIQTVTPAEDGDA